MRIFVKFATVSPILMKMKERTYRLAASQLCLLLLLCAISYGNVVPTNGPEIEEASFIRPNAHSAVPLFVHLKPGVKIPGAKFPSWFAEHMKTGAGQSLKLMRSETDKLGQVHDRYQQHYKGIPVESAVYIAHSENGYVRKMNGVFAHPVNLGSTVVLLDEAEALARALEQYPADRYKWELDAEETWLKKFEGDPAATYYPKGELTILSAAVFHHLDRDFLTYKFDIYAHQPLKRAEVFIDAHTGQLVLSFDGIHTVNKLGYGETRYSGVVEIMTDSLGPGQFVLQESTRGNGVETYDLNRTTDLGSAVDFEDDNNYWDTKTDGDDAAIDAHWGAEMTYDYFMQVHGRNSYNGSGGKLISYVHYDLGYINASWHGSYMVYGDGGNGWGPLTALDICGHEIGHGVTQHTADLNYINESGALNESFSDIFGTAVEFFAKPNEADWLIGEDIVIQSNPLRSMERPNRYSDPDTYNGLFWHTDPSDNGGVHTNSGVQNFWFYILAVGDTGVNDNHDPYQVAGIGLEKAADIAYRNLSVYLTPSSDHSDARFYAIEAAKDLYGNCSIEHYETEEAWYAVGVGDSSTYGVKAMFSLPSDTLCESPISLSVENNSTYATNYLWDFGDGSISSQENPSHTFSDTGTYQITLIANGGAVCGADTQSHMVTIYEIKADFEFGQDPVYVGDVVKHYNTSKGASSWIWRYGSGFQNSHDTLMFRYTKQGANTVSITVTNDNGACEETASKSTFAFFHTGIREQKNGITFRVSPIPARDRIFLEFQQPESLDTRITVLNMVGEEMIDYYPGQTAAIRQSLDLSDLAKGAYILKINSGEQVYSRKIVVE